MAKKKAPSSVLELPVSFGNVSIGDKTARIGVTVDRSNITVKKADDSICEKRLTGQIIAKPNGEAPDQGRLQGMERLGDSELDATFDVKGFSVTKDALSFGLTFLLGSVDVAELASFAKREGRLIIEDAEEIPEPAPLLNGEAEEEDD